MKEKENMIITGHIHTNSIDSHSTLSSITSDLEAPFYGSGSVWDHASTNSYAPTPEDIGGEKRNEVKTIRVDYICTECRKGEMRPTGITYYSNPAQYQHSCTECGHTENFVGKIYPYFDYDDVE